MHPVTWDMRYGLPNQIYLEFVRRYILLQETKHVLIDPFALDVSPDMVGIIHVNRSDVEAEVGQPGTKIIVGPVGRGKTALFRKLSTSPTVQTLVVPLPLTEIGTSVSEHEILRGEVSLLDLLARHIFECYWQNLLLDPVKFDRFYYQLRQHEWWKSRLRWFYHRYPPLNPEISEQFELVAWLNALPPHELPSLKDSPKDILRGLVRFVTFTASQGFDVALARQPYAQIQILIDGTERLSSEAIKNLIQDTQKLYDLYLGQMQFKLFADPMLLPQIEAMECVRQGRVTVYRLPPWNEQDLRQLLDTRLRTYQPGEYVEGNWGQLIPDTHLQLAARMRFIETIVKNAREPPDDAEDDLDAPIHVLRLSRVLLAACAGCWEKDGFKLPLGMKDIDELICLYWNLRKEKKK
jgi:hypothetical protein